MHEDISMDGHLEKEGQQIVVVCHPHHLLDVEYRKKKYVQTKNPRPRNGAFSQHIDVLGSISHHSYNKSLFIYVPTSRIQKNAS